MSDTLDDDKPTRRDFLYITTGAFGVVGAASVAWPLIDQLNPDASVKACLLYTSPSPRDS